MKDTATARQIVNGPDVKAENTFDAPGQVAVRETHLVAAGPAFTYAFEPHSVTALACPLGK
jgi:alpha-L-arabinofuranosidase